MALQRDFVVTITTWEGSFDYECFAPDANGAKKQARAYMRDECGHDRHCGRATYRARRAN